VKTPQSARTHTHMTYVIVECWLLLLRLRTCSQSQYSTPHHANTRAHCRSCRSTTTAPTILTAHDQHCPQAITTSTHKHSTHLLAAPHADCSCSLPSSRDRQRALQTAVRYAFITHNTLCTTPQRNCSTAERRLLAALPLAYLPLALHALLQDRVLHRLRAV
jgi:hypothetical protein